MYKNKIREREAKKRYPEKKEEGASGDRKREGKKKRQ